MGPQEGRDVAEFNKGPLNETASHYPSRLL